MKHTLILLILATSSYATSQTEYLEVNRQFLADAPTVRGREISRQRLDSNLSSALQDKVTRKTEPFHIDNLAAIQSRIGEEKRSQQPSIVLRINTFDTEPPLDLRLNAIDTVGDRDIMRGEVVNHPGSKVKLVSYENQISGRISFAGSRKLLLLQSIGDGVSAVYEVDVSDITYD